MTAFRLFLFGSPRIEHGGQILPMRRSKALALLAYLAVARRPQHRDTLVTLVWPEFDPDSARNNLRRELSLLKTMLGDKVLVADRMQIALDPDADLSLDVSAFQEQVVLVRQHDHQPSDLCPRCADALANAARLYTDDFMAGFSLPDSAAFDEWQFFQREELRQQLAWVLQSLVAHHRDLGAYNAALEYARRWLSLDPLHALPRGAAKGR